MIDTLARRFTKHVLHTLASKGFWKEKGVLFIIFMAALYHLVSDILSLCYRNLN